MTVAEMSPNSSKKHLTMTAVEGGLKASVG